MHNCLNGLNIYLQDQEVLSHVDVLMHARGFFAEMLNIY